MPGVDWQRLDDVIFGCANQAGEDNRNVGRMALLLAGMPQEVPGIDRQPPVRLEHGRRRHAARAIAAGEMELAIAGGVESMSRAPFVMNKADARVRARHRARGHHPRLAVREPEDGAGVRHRLDGRDRRERRRRMAGLARRPGRVRAAQPAARRRRDRGRPVRRRDRAGHRAAAQGHGHRVRRRAPAAGHDARGAGPAEADRAAGRYRDCRQRLGHQRRRLRGAARVRGGGRGATV